jgi:hypothetical protein
MRRCTATRRGEVTGMPGPAGPYRRIRASTEQAPNGIDLDHWVESGQSARLESARIPGTIRDSRW